ncbi:hypothetical protein IDH44_00725 [Paenibacillus sp. IB182496]|uniref:Alpha-L-rhamnosidase-like protein n=1 Tax=Paenibacillus sabuli TaxID=2772509 RepID=A0A927BQM2_9BACL|nr:glycosyl hydrolase [Paenibacillus sabuli]MBD2843698.1 hypothetical protein [Paenibacillus sabuli]
MTDNDTPDYTLLDSDRPDYDTPDCDMVAARFAAPGPDERPAPFWVWNEAITPERIRFQLRQLQSSGFGGAFVHARPGLLTGYLSMEWWSLWSEALRVAEELGLRLYIYDEHGYPSGFGGGEIAAALPDCAATGVSARIYDLDAPDAALARLPEALPELIRAYAVAVPANGASPGSGTAPWTSMADAAGAPLELTRDLTDVPIAQWPAYGRRFLVFEMHRATPSRWLGGFTYVDLLRPEVTQLFLQQTHEAYRQRYGDRFGTVIPALFTDEPEITAGNLYAKDDYMLPFSYWLAARFEQLRGYSLLDHLPCLLLEAAGCGIVHTPQRVRYDYYATIRELWVAGSVQPTAEWCRRHGIAYTGHYVEHNWPHPFHRTSPAIMSLYEYMDWPGIDLLHTYLLREDGTDPHDLVTLREAHSAANQLGKARVLCEAYGAGGWESSFEDLRRIGDWMLVHGVNFVNPHLTLDSMTGPRKRDHPQSFDWRQPWWPHYRTLSDYTARLCAALGQGETVNRLLVLNPTTSTFVMTPAEERESGYRARVEATRALTQRLCDAQWDFDFGDEFIMARHGRATDGRLRVGRRTYALVILPPAVRHLTGSTLRLLETLLDGGGAVLALCEPIRLADGLAEPRAEQLCRHPGWRQADSLDALDTLLRARLQPRLVWTDAAAASGARDRDASAASDACDRGSAEQDAAAPPQGLAHLRRELADGSALYFVVNSHPASRFGTIEVEGSSAERWDAWTGARTPIGAAGSDGRLRIAATLLGSDSLLLHVQPIARPKGASLSPLASRAAASDANAAVAPKSIGAGSARIGPLEVQPERLNLLPLMHVDLTVGGKRYADIHTLYAAKRIFQHHGFATDPLECGVQYRDRVLDRDRFMPPDSGFEAVYALHVDDAEAVAADTRLIIERPELYTVEVNGRPLAGDFGPSWLDSEVGACSVAGLLVPGRNEIVLRASPFRVLHQLEAIYLEGGFAVRADREAGVWTIARPLPLRLGSWTEQGYPFYAGAMTYRRTLALAPGFRRVVLGFPSWAGTVAVVEVDGAQAGLIGLDRGNELDVTRLVLPGEQHIALRVYGSLRNLLGPHFDPRRPRGYVWPGNWRAGGQHGTPPPTQYDLIAYGLLEEMTVRVED